MSSKSRALVGLRVRRCVCVTLSFRYQSERLPLKPSESKQKPAGAHHHKTTATQLDPHVRVAASSARRTPPLSNTLHSPGLRTSHSLELVSHCLGFCFYAARTSTVWYLVCAHHTPNEVPRLHAPDAPSPCPCADTVSAQ